MPEVYKKFRDSQGLASVSRALQASKATEGFKHFEEGKLKDPRRRTGIGGQEEAVKGLKGSDGQSQRPGKMHDDQKKKKRRKSEDGEHGDVAQTPETSTPLKRKKKMKKGIIQSIGAEGGAALPSPSLEPAEGVPESGTPHAEGEGSQERKTFRDFYVKTFSSAFASELLDLRQAEGERMSLGLLLRQIESGVNIFSDLEKGLLQDRAAS